MHCKNCVVGVARTRIEWVRKRAQIECAVSGRWRGKKADCDLSPEELAGLAECVRRIAIEKRSS